MFMRSLKSTRSATRSRCITESIVTCVNTMHRCVSVYNAVSGFANLCLRKSKQHVDLLTVLLQTMMILKNCYGRLIRNLMPVNPP